MSTWGTLLSCSDSLTRDAIRKLQALAITTVEDLECALQSNSDELRLLIDEAELCSFYQEFPVRDEVLKVAMAAAEDPPVLGAEPPPEVQLFEEAPEELFLAALNSLGPLPDDAQDSEGDETSTRMVECSRYMQPVRSQGARGTCVAHAVSAVLECLEKRENGQSIDLSPQFLYWSAKHNDGHIEKSGTFIRVAAKQAAIVGVCEESYWPYNPDVVGGNESHCPPPPGAMDAAGDHKAGSDVQVSRTSTAIRDLIDQSTPVAFSVPVYASWINPFGKVPMPIPHAPCLGGHAMCAVGYRIDPTAPGGGFIIAKNSWGPDRAAQHPLAPGYFDVPFEYIDEYGWEVVTLRL